MSAVLIEGMVSTVYLRRGEQAAVELTDSVSDLVRRGFVRIVDTHGNHKPERDDPASGSDAAADSGGAGEPPLTGKGSGRTAWMEFLTEQGVPFSPEASRDDLIAAWQAAQPSEDAADG